MALMSMVKEMVERGEVKGEGVERIEGMIEEGTVERWTAEGIRKVGEGKWKEAQELFLKVASSPPPSKPTFTKFTLEEFYTTYVLDVNVDWGFVGVVNASLCMLYSNDLPLSLNLLLDNIKKEPGRFLKHEAIFNLCTLYDLSEGEGKEKKEEVRMGERNYGPKTELGGGIRSSQQLANNLDISHDTLILTKTTLFRDSLCSP